MSNQIKYKGALLAEDSSILKPGGILYDAKELRADALEANSLQLTVVSESGTIKNFDLNDKVEYFRDGRRRGIYYLQSVTRVGPKSYEIYALSAVGRLMAMPHVGGIYTGETAEAVAREICGDIPVLVETVYADRQVYGWLPYAEGGDGRSARDNLADLLFSIGAWLGTDENGVLRIEKLWDGTASSIGRGRIDARRTGEKTDPPVSAVAVTEHKFIPGTEEAELFSGTATQGKLVTFDEPMHSLAATGFTVTRSGANFAVLSSGSGILTGKKYVHNTSVVTRTVTAGASENVIPVTDVTLISLVNSTDIATRMADYYAHRVSLSVDLKPSLERAGYVVQIYHPWDKALVSACIASRETKISGLLKTRTTALLGFAPPQPDASQYYDRRVVLTGSGTYTPPENCTAMRAVLIGAGQGGQCGQPGELPTYVITSSTETRTAAGHTWTETKKGFLGKNLPPASGGAPGEGGHPGKVYAADLSVTPGQSFAYACGVGGLGGAYEPETVPEGSLGTATTFGTLSSESGSYSDSGYYDTITGERLAEKGKTGVPGGNGVGYAADASDGDDVVTPPDIVVDGVHYTAGAPGEPDIDNEGGNSAKYGSWKGTSRGGLGGGPAYKASGNAGVSDGEIGGSYASASVRCGLPGKGADAQPPEKPTVYGNGGFGGNGGGGTGQLRWGNYVGVITREDAEATVSDWNLGVYPRTSEWQRGAGSVGGDGADGCIILYLRLQTKMQPGALVAKNKWYLDRLGRRMIV